MRHTSRERWCIVARRVGPSRRESSLLPEVRAWPARENVFRDAIDIAVELMRRIDARFPASGKIR